MENSVVGIAGAVRINQLTGSGLTRAEQHGKRLDATSRARAISVDPPITTSGLDLNRLYEEHVAGAFVPRAKAKAMHVILQFPKELTDGDAGEAMLENARTFAERVFGKDAIFADRVDRDEKSRHVVDLFVAPRYVKTTKRTSKIAVSLTRHLKALAIEYGHPPVPHGTGRALQDAWFEYLRDEVGLRDVQRGARKEFAGDDWKSAEQLRSEELAKLQATAEREIEFGFAAGREVGLENAERESLRLKDELRRREEELSAQAQSQLREEHRLRVAFEELEAEKTVISEEAKKAARIEKSARLEADAIRAKAKGDAEEILRDARIRADEQRDAILAARKAAANEREQAASELKAVSEKRSYEEQVSNKRISLLDNRETLIERREAELKDRALHQDAVHAGISAWIQGDILRADKKKSGERFFVWRDEAAKERVRPQIAAAVSEVWKLVNKFSTQVATKVRELEEVAMHEARQIVAKTSGAVQDFMDRFDRGSHLEREELVSTHEGEAVQALTQDKAIQSVLRSTDQEDFDDLLLRAAAAGFGGKRGASR